jgi:hypothetical protein
MKTLRRFAAFSFFCLAAGAMPVHAEKKTVCSITVNSPDEKEAFRARLPKGEYEFVELIEKGRPDWLRSSCQKGVQCDVLVVSGHFNAGDDFYSDKNEVVEHLKVDELERASCSNSCPGLFAKLKEVYLFGCESLNPDASKYASSYGESGRERMRRIFANVPVIYGFSSSAPVGPTAAMLLNRYFDSSKGEIATGRPSSRLLQVFSKNSMTSTSGVRDNEPQAAYRQQVCQFFDERQSAAQKLTFIHSLMRRDINEARASFDRIEKLFASFTDGERQAPAFSQALAQISADDATREKFLVLARTGRPPSVRARMIDLASHFGWLSPEDERSEQLAMINDILASNTMGYAEVDLNGSLNDDHSLDGALSRLKLSTSRGGKTTNAAALACLGSTEGHNQVLRALASPDEKDVQIAQVYLRHRPISDRAELRLVARDISQMPGSGAKVRALDTLGRLNISDREVLDDLAQAFAEARSVNVQRAIAEIFIRSDTKSMARPQLVALLREHRLRAPGGGEDLIDTLIRRLQS